MSTAELEYRLLYSMVVAGKSAAFADGALGRFFAECDCAPFEYIRRLIAQDSPSLFDVLKSARTGNYCKLCTGFSMAAKADLNLETCTPEQLEQIHGVGPKTSRFFIIWTRPGAKHAALDTHVLKWLRYLGHDAPKATPSSEKYAKLEVVFLAQAEVRGMSARDLDSAIWDYCSQGNHRDGDWPAKLRKFSK